jgi:hypothetical protein
MYIVRIFAGEMSILALYFTTAFGALVAVAVTFRRQMKNQLTTNSTSAHLGAPLKECSLALFRQVAV